jgi:hypothetical protein
MPVSFMGETPSNAISTGKFPGNRTDALKRQIPQIAAKLSLPGQRA